MLTRPLIFFCLLTSCSLSGSDVTKTIEVSADRLAEIEAQPYPGGNGPGGFSAAALAFPEDDASPGGVMFTGFGPYLHEMGFTNNMVLTKIDGVDVTNIFADRWRELRLKDPSAYDAAHYQDLIQYIFLRESVDEVVLTIHVKNSIATMSEGRQKPGTEVWRLEFRR